MGRDNSPRERQRKQLARKESRRAPYDRILIVSEGSKTEPFYFSEIRTAYRLQTTNVTVLPSVGTAPVQVVQYAHDLFASGDRHKGIQPRAFERIYAVFDRDDHDSYFDALQLAQSLDGRLRNDAKQPVTFKAIASIPSFELWLLLHYEDIHAPVHRGEVMRRLKRHIPGYQKGASGVFATTRPGLEAATQRARWLSEHFTARDDPEPYTAIVDLVTILTTLRALMPAPSEPDQPTQGR